MSRKMMWLAAAIGAAFAAAGCGPASSANADEAAGNEAAAAEAAAPAQPVLGEAVQPTGKVVEIRMVSDANGNRFEPAEVEVHRGDVVRWTLGSGAHNVYFPPEKNPGVSKLPAASDILQLPGQTYELLVGIEHGDYVFECVPHAPLGMVGKIEVED